MDFESNKPNSMNWGIVKTRKITTRTTADLDWQSVPNWINEFDKCKLFYFTGYVIRKSIKVMEGFGLKATEVDCLVWKVRDMDHAYVEITPVDNCLYIEIHQEGYYVQGERDYGDFHIESGHVDAVGVVELNPKNANEYREIIDCWLPGYQNHVSVNQQNHLCFHGYPSFGKYSMTFSPEPFYAEILYIDDLGNVTIKYPRHWLEVEDLPIGISSGYKVPRVADWWTYHDTIQIRLQAYFRKILGIPLTIEIQRR